MATQHLTTCNLCEACCGIVVTTDGATVTSIRGDEDDPLSRGALCPKAAALADLHADPDRLRSPMRRVGARWEPIAWDAAFDEVAARIRATTSQHGRHAVAMYQGNPTVHSLGAMTFGPLLASQLHTRNHFSATSVDQLPHMLAAYTMFGHQLMLPVPDIDRTDLLVILGGNPVVSNGSLMTAPGFRRRLAALRARGGELIVIDPRRTETAALADRHVSLRPGTDALLLLAMINTLFDDQLVELGRLGSCCDGLTPLRDAARRFAPEDVASHTGIDAATIRDLARTLAAAPTAACYGRLGTCTQPFGGVSAWLLYAINALTGNLDEPGGMMFATPAFDLIAMFTRAGRAGSFARFTGRARPLPEFSGELPSSILADEILAAGPGAIRALIVSAGNPVLSLPNGRKLDDALSHLDFMVAIDPYINETTRHAHIILPPTMLLERDHCDLAFPLLSVRTTAKLSPPVFAPAPHQRHDWQIFLALATRLAIDARGGRLARALGAAARAVGERLGPRAIVDLGLRLGPHRLSVRALRAAPHGVDLGPLRRRLPAALKTANRRIDLAPALYLGDLDRLARAAREPADTGGTLQLIGRRHLRSNNSWLHNSQRMVKGPPRCTLLIHPDDAAPRRLGDGAIARVTSRVGTVDAPVEITRDIMPGVVSLPHGWGHDRPGVRLAVAAAHPGVSANDLTDDQQVDELTGTACLNGVPVRVAPAP